MIISLIAALLGSITVMLVLGILTGQLQRTPRRAMERILKLEASRLKQAPDTAEKTPVNLLRADKVSNNERISAFFRRFDWSIRRAETLDRANIPLKVSEYALALAAGGAIVGAITMWLTGFPPAGLVTLVVFIFIVEWWVRRRVHSRIDKFNEQLPAALQMMAVSLQSGFSISDSIRTVSQDLEPPLADEFGRLLDETRAGASFEDSLERLQGRIESPDLNIAIEALTVHAKVGGNLGEILDQVAGTMREREKLRREIRSLTAQERMSANIVAALPIWVLGFMFVSSPETVEALWTTTTGTYVLIAAALFEVAGFMVTRRVTQVEV